jgi:hypothetical protein
MHQDSCIAVLATDGKVKAEGKKMISECLNYTSAISNHMIAFHSQFYATNPAYIDPGTGSLIIQMAIGFLVGGLVGVKLFWNRITGFFRGLTPTSSRHDRTEN